MRKQRRQKGQNIGKQEAQFAQELYNDGLTLQQVADRTGISVAQIGRMKIDGAWGDDMTPPFNQADMTRFLDKYFFKLLLSLLREEEEDETRAVLNLKNISDTKRNIEELIQAVDNRSLVLSLQKAMAWIVEKHPDADSTLELLQQYHDEVSRML